MSRGCKFFPLILLLQFSLGGEITYFPLVKGLNKPVYVTAPEGEIEPLFIVEQRGIILQYSKGKLNPLPILDISDRIHNPKLPGDERGLLGMALHPEFKINGRLYLNYINLESNTIIAEFQADLETFKTDSATEKIILEINQPYSNHNGGQLAFGPDGMLYIGMGDGGSGGDPKGNAQNLGSLLGKILRIDVDGEKTIFPADNPSLQVSETKPGIWVYGLRNPWRFSFDRLTGDLYIGDVGQNSFEEINSTPFNESAGSNFGWNIMEGNHCYPPESNCNDSGFVLPVFEYPNNANYFKTLIGLDQPHVKGCSVTGGYVYRGTKIPELNGHYFFGDYCTGKIWSFKLEDGIAAQFKDWDELIFDSGQPMISSFGEDGTGELYLIDHGGIIYKMKKQ